MLFYYPILIHEEDGFWAEFPDLDGCNAQGDTLNELLDDAKGALETHIYCILIDGEHLNKPSDPRSLPTDEKSFVALISADVDINKENRSVKKNAHHSVLDE